MVFVLLTYKKTVKRTYKADFVLLTVKNLKQCRVIVVQLGKYLLHDGFAEKDCLGVHPELLTITVNGSHLAVIQIYHLAMLPHQSFLLFLQIFRIDIRMSDFPFSCHHK